MVQILAQSLSSGMGLPPSPPPLVHQAPPGLPSAPRGVLGMGGGGCPGASQDRGWQQCLPMPAPSWAGSPIAWWVGSQLDAFSWQG